MEENKHSDKNWFAKNVLWIFLIILSGLFGLQWYFLNKNISEYKNSHKEQINRLESIKTNLIDLDNVEKKQSKYIFKYKDIEKINSNLNVLAQNIYDERNNAEAIIDKDIDRLNLYMALGIGFLAMLGVFVPISVNILSNNDLKEKQDSLETELAEIKKEAIDLKDKVKDLKKEDVDEAVKLANEAITKSKEIAELKKSTDEIIPKISVISLQIAIHRLFNISSLSQPNTNEKSKEIYKELFSSIKEHLERCKDEENLYIEKSIILKQTIIDFSNLLYDDGFKFTSYLVTRGIDVKVKELIIELRNLSKSNSNNQIENFTALLKKFDEFINEIDKIDA
jgi:hypothetical protein